MSYICPAIPGKEMYSSQLLVHLILLYFYLCKESYVICRCFTHICVFRVKILTLDIRLSGREYTELNGMIGTCCMLTAYFYLARRLRQLQCGMTNRPSIVENHALSKVLVKWQFKHHINLLSCQLPNCFANCIVFFV